jgi:hypothetical protein
MNRNRIGGPARFADVPVSGRTERFVEVSIGIESAAAASLLLLPSEVAV